MRKNKYIYWTYNGFKPRRDFVDPRLAVAKHIGWQKLFGPDTMWNVPEPDNYNRAILTEKPTECVFIEDQVIYKDVAKDVWITLMYVPDEQLSEYDAWMLRLQPLANWQHNNAPKIRWRKESMA
jgi:hypothetical protein